MFIALWMFHQWYRGGEIPIIRPANNYISEDPADSEFLTPKTSLKRRAHNQVRPGDSTSATSRADHSTLATPR